MSGAQIRWLIERNDSGVTYWFCPKEGRDAGVGPTGGWTPIADRALGFARKVDGEEFITSFLSMHATADLKVTDHGFG